ncbi:MAG: hypothetical protein IPK33_11285 [Gemmatimonadetes bacterium]|nr:hypothetical protein [Gemmatimonadota bacterium]
MKEGDVVAGSTAPASPPRWPEVNLALQKAQAQYEQAMLDSTLNLSKAREEIIDGPGAGGEEAGQGTGGLRGTHGQAPGQIDHEKATRPRTGQGHYKTKTEQAQARCGRSGPFLERQRNRLRLMRDVMQGFSIRAPANGMLIYVKEWNGKKKVAGPQVGAWDPTVATLPDLCRWSRSPTQRDRRAEDRRLGQPVSLSLDSGPRQAPPREGAGSGQRR